MKTSRKVLLTYTLPTPVGVGHQWTENTNTGCNQWLSLAKIALKVPPVGRNCSLVASTNMCGEGITWRATNNISSSNKYFLCQAHTERGESNITPRDHDKSISHNPWFYCNFMCTFFEVEQATFRPTLNLSQRLTPSQAKLVDKVDSSVKGTS
jgi:hypothetical protein